jgi:hypothetical protein
MSDFRDRFGIQLTAASASLLAAGAGDFRVRLGVQLTDAAGELAAARRGLAGAPERRPWALRLPRLGLGPAHRPLARVLGLSDFRVRFGIQLTRAAGELAAARRGLAGAPERAAWRPRVPRALIPRLSRPIIVGLSLTAFAGTAVAALALWTPVLGDSRFGEAPPTISASAPPADQLASLAVLRRAQSPADRSGALATGALQAINASSSGVRTNYIRVLAGGSAASGFVLVPVAERRASLSSPAAIPDALCLYAAQSGAFAVNCYTLAEVRAGAARDVAFGQVFGLAPDGVSAVTITAAGGVDVSAPVQNNFFDATLPAGAGGPTASPTVTFSGGS